MKLAQREYYKYNHVYTRRRRLELPFDVICNIVSKLPIKPLIRFLCLSKSLYRLRNDQVFLDLQLKQALSQPRKFILTQELGLCGGAMKNVYLVDEEKKHKWKATRVEIHRTDDWIGEQGIVGSCNGLLCVLCTDYKFHGPIIVYNPIRKESVVIPVKLTNSEWYRGSISFGYDTICRKYKVLIVRRVVSAIDNGKEICITTLGENSWRILNVPYVFDFIFYIRHNTHSLFLRGVFYWIIQKKGVNSVLSIDISSEKIEEIPFSRRLERKVCSGDRCYLATLKENLAFIAYNVKNVTMQIWSLVDSKKGIWDYQSTHNLLSFFTRSLEPNDQYHFKIEGMVGDDGILWECYSKYYSSKTKYHLVRFNPTRKIFDRDFVENIEIVPRCFDVVSFVPTLVSPILSMS